MSIVEMEKKSNDQSTRYIENYDCRDFQEKSTISLFSLATKIKEAYVL
jgi:hypothetical protein